MATKNQDVKNTNRPPRYYPTWALKPKPKVPPIPKVAAFGWNSYPAATRLMMAGVFFGLVGLTTPFWVYVETGQYGYATFGLWFFCLDEKCTSIHDNLVPGRSVPAWYHMAAFSFAIGVIASCVALGILVNNADDGKLKMTLTVHRTALCILGIAVVEQLVGVYLFAVFVDETDFLYRHDDLYEIEFHGSWYASAVSILIAAVSCFSIWIDRKITHSTKKKSKAAPVISKSRKVRRDSGSTDCYGNENAEMSGKQRRRRRMVNGRHDDVWSSFDASPPPYAEKDPMTSQRQPYSLPNLLESRRPAEMAEPEGAGLPWPLPDQADYSGMGHNANGGQGWVGEDGAQSKQDLVGEGGAQSKQGWVGEGGTEYASYPPGDAPVEYSEEDFDRLKQYMELMYAQGYELVYDGTVEDSTGSPSAPDVPSGTM